MMYFMRKGFANGRVMTWMSLFCMLFITVFAQAVVKTNFQTKSGVVLLSYAPKTPAIILAKGGATVWQGVLTNKGVSKISLAKGDYQLQTPDEVCFISNDLIASSTPDAVVSTKRMAAKKYGAAAKGVHSASLSGPLSVVAVPWVGDNTYADNPPNPQSRHTVFQNVPTRLKAVINGGTGPYYVTWDPYSNGSPMTTITATDPYIDATVFTTYSDAPGTLIKATVTVTDSNAASATAYYYILVGSSSIRAQRVARSTDEGLWFLHCTMQRSDAINTNAYNSADLGWISQQFGYTVSPTSMYAIDLENTGRSITGGVNLSHDPAKDPYVEDLNRLINYLTDNTILAPVDLGSVGPLTTKTYDTGGTVTIDTHGPGGTANGICLRSTSGRPFYEGGMQLQAISQAGNTNAPVPNRPDYASYYDLIGDFVDGMQFGQGWSGTAEGGWRYDWGFNESDGSAVAWCAIGLRAAEVANLLTAGVPKSPIIAAPWLKTELGIWLAYDQLTDIAAISNQSDFRAATPAGFDPRDFHLFGGFGYTDPYSGTNSGKSGGGLMALKYIGKSNTDPAVVNAEGFLYRFLWTYDGPFNWSSSRDSYGMYNMFKGLKEAGVNLLTDANGSLGNDMDGVPLIPVDWYGTLVDFICGQSDTDLGHQVWQGNSTLNSPSFSALFDGHYESSAARTSAIAPFNRGEWFRGASDAEAGIELTTAWDLAIMQGSVFNPGPVAVIGHPDTNSNENYVPLVLNGNPFFARFDPGNSFELNPAAKIVHANWDFGDGSAPVDYDLPVQGGVGGSVPVNTGQNPIGNVITHSYAALGDYVVKLTVTDDKGDTNTTTLTVHVITAPYPPVVQLQLTPQNGSFNVGNKFGVLADGSLTLQMDGTGSYNLSPLNSFNGVHNGNGISQFAWEWPTDPSGNSESPALFDEGGAVVDPNLNSGSKAGMQTYMFQFDPNNIPTGITIGLQVGSNIIQIAGQPPKSSILYYTIHLVKNDTLIPPPPVIKNLSVHNTTDTTTIISFDTVVNGTAPSATTALIAYGLSNAYGLTVTDNTLRSHHDLMISGLGPNTSYHFKVTATAPLAAPAVSNDAVFKTLPNGVPTPQITVKSRSFDAQTNVMTVVYNLTNNGTGTAKNITLSAVTANKGVTYLGPLVSPPSSIAPGGSATFTLKNQVPVTNPAVANFTAQLKVTYSNAGLPVVNYLKSVSNLVLVP